MPDNDNTVGIGIKTSLGSSVDEVDKLAKKVNELNNSMDRLDEAREALKTVTRLFQTMAKTNFEILEKNLQTIPDLIDRLNEKLSSINTEVLEKNMAVVDNVMSKYKNTMQDLAKIQDVKLDSALSVDGISNVKNVIDDFTNIDPTNFSKVGTAMKNFKNSLSYLNKFQMTDEVEIELKEKMNKISIIYREFVESLSKYDLNAFGSSLRAIAALPKTMKSFETVDTNTFEKRIQNLSRIIQSFIATLKEGSAELNSLASILNKVGATKNVTAFSNVSKQVDDLGNKAERTRKKLHNMLSFGKLYAFYNQLRHFSTGFTNMMNKSIDFTETENYFSRAMGNMRDEAMKFQNDLGEMFGTAIPEMMKAQATFKNMLGTLGGLDEDVSYMLSERITKMAMDYASLYNTTLESANTKFQAALSKQVRPIRSQSGYDITQAVLGQTLQEIGINDRKISQLSEIEKRLTIILTLQRQMANSNAMGDFAATIEQPANQLKVLQNQLSEVGRWISAVFYGIIGSVLPYINGFLMAVKELVKTFAFFVGYEMPDSTKNNGTILDQMTDGAEDFSDTVGGINSGLDDTSKKLKEIEGQLASFDKLNVISPPDDSSNGGSGNSGAGAGTGVDPRLLQALKDMDYIFGNVRMKANDIRDKLLEWADIIGKNINENVFKPLQNSWNKYGSGITYHLESTFENLETLIKDVLDNAGNNFKDRFQSWSNLFFSLLETASIVSDGISKALLDIWLHGGKDLWNSLGDLVQAFVDLATSVNDNFVKPLLKSFNKTLLPMVTSFVGMVLKTISKLMKPLVNLVELIAESEPLVVGLTTAFISMFAAIKIAKFTQLINAIRATGNSMSVFKLLLLEHSSLFRKFYTSFDNGKGVISSFKNVYISLSNALENTSVWQSVTSVLKSFGTNLTSLTSGVPVLGSAVKCLGSIVGWLVANPLVALTGSIAAVVGGFLLLSSSQEKSKYEMEDYSEHIQKNIKDLDEMKDSLKSVRDEAEKSYSSSIAEIDVVGKYIDELNGLSNKDGYIEDINKARFYIEEINKVMPESVSLTDDYRLAWNKTPDEIKKTIDALKEKAKWDSLSQLYSESLTAQYEAQRKCTQAIEERTKKQEKLHKLEKENVGLNYSAENQRQIEQLTADIDGLNKVIDKSSKAYQDASKNMDYYDKEMNESSNNIQLNNEKMSNSYKKLSDKHKESIFSVVNNLKTLQEQEDFFVKSGISNDDKRVKSTQKAISTQIHEYINLAIQYGLTHDDMLNMFDEYGVKLSDKQKKQAIETLDITKGQNNELMLLLKQHGIDIESEQGKQYQKALTEAQKEGTKSGSNYLSNLKSEFLKGNIANETLKVLKTGQIVADRNKITVSPYINKNSWQNAIQVALNGLSAMLNIGLSVLSGGDIKFPKFATGGFPSMGQLFYANENGVPELVGRQGNRTVVANQNQVSDVILDAMERKGLLNSGNIKVHLEVPVVINKREVAKLKKEIDLEEYLKTGKKK